MNAPPFRILLTLLASAGLFTPSGASLLVSESFDSYNSGAISGQGSANSVFAGGWTRNGSIVSLNEIPEYTTPLSAGGITGGGNALVFARERNNGPRRDFLPSTRPQPTDANPLYISYLMRLSGDSDSYFYEASGNWDHAFAGIDGNKATFNARYKNGSTGTTSYDTSQDLLIVVRVASSSQSVWVNPTSEADTPGVTHNTIQNWSTLSAIGFTSNNNGPTIVDNLMIGDSFAEVMGIPEPSSLLLLSAAAFGFLGLRSRKRVHSSQQ